jgi:hypothetical protein
MNSRPSPNAPLSGFGETSNKTNLNGIGPKHDRRRDAEVHQQLRNSHAKAGGAADRTRLALTPVRAGVQPMVHLTVGGRTKIDVAAGKSVT